MSVSYLSRARIETIKQWPQWVSMADGEWRRCTRCVSLGYGLDSYYPTTHEFWPTVHGRIWFGRCNACCTELALTQKTHRITALAWQEELAA